MTIHYIPSTESQPAVSGVPDALRTHSVYRKFFKRALDIAIIVVAAPIILPLILVLAGFVARDGGMPFYRQKRVGRGGKIFTMWKLRTMVKGADDLLEAHLDEDAAARQEWDSTQKLKSDPRITRFGAFLRKYSLDEFPQLWNVLIGDMSLVGPRPMMPDQQELYPGVDYYSLRPGVTGIWQVSQRNDSTFADRAKFDAQYNREISLTTDLKLLLATVRVVVRATGH